MKPRPLKILAVDPGKHHHAYSSWHGGVLVDYGKHLREDLEFWDELIKKHDKIYVEDQYLGTKDGEPKVSVRAMFQLVRAAHELITIAKLRGVEWEYINPKKWESKVLHASGRMTRGEIKHISRILASEIAGEKIVDHNIADAINMGLGVVTKAYVSLKEYFESLAQD